MEKTIVKSNGNNFIAKAVTEILKFDPTYKCCQKCGIDEKDIHILPTGYCKHCQMEIDMYYYNLNVY